MSDQTYALFEPVERRSCVVFASPHSGRAYPDAFLQASLLDAQTIRSSEDAFVDQLFAAAPEFGAPLLIAHGPRCYVDLNRSPDDLDPALIKGVRRSGHNPRIASGLGVIPRVVSNGRVIYSGKITRDEADLRLQTYWYPYHQMLQAQLDLSRQMHGQAVLVDCHSMPHEAVDSTLRNAGGRPDIVIGDRFGAAARGDIVDQVEAAFAAAGLTVVRNAPFAGAYITQAYGRPSRQQHAVQIEIDRALYMDEAHVVPNENFEAFQALLRGVIAEIAEICATGLPLAAE